MLTADLITVREQKGKLTLSSLTPARRKRASELATSYIEIAKAHHLQPRGLFDAACAAVEISVRERKLAAALLKMVTDRCTFECAESIDHSKLRKALFLEASLARTQASDHETFSRLAVLESFAKKCEQSIEWIEENLYGDRKEAYLLKSHSLTTAHALLDHYELECAQAILLKAQELTLHITASQAASYRQFLNKLKFHQLLFTIEPEGKGYRLHITGPLSLFEQTTKYGLQFALLPPALLPFSSWKLSATIRWKPNAPPAVFELSKESLPLSARLSEPFVRTDLEAFIEAFKKLDSGWKVHLSEEILRASGKGIVVPDIVFTHAATGRKVYMEVMGYWSRDALLRRLELLEKGAPFQIIFACSEKLRVSQELLPEKAPAFLHLYKRALSARQLAALLAEIAP